MKVHGAEVTEVKPASVGDRGTAADEQLIKLKLGVVQGSGLRSRTTEGADGFGSGSDPAGEERSYASSPRGLRSKCGTWTRVEPSEIRT